MTEKHTNVLGPGEPPAPLEAMIEELQVAASEKGHTLYSIHFRNAGVGIEWFAAERAGPEPEFPRPASAKDLHRYNDARSHWTRNGLVIYGYRDTLREAVKADLKRMRDAVVAVIGDAGQS